MKLADIRDDNKIFEVLMLEASAAGLKRQMIQSKKEEYERAFEKFDVDKLSRFTERDVDRLMRSDTKIIKTRRKIDAVIHNAKKVKEIQEEFGSFDKYVRGIAVGKDLRQDSLETQKTKNRLTEDLKDRGFKFIGPSAVMSFLYVIGLVSLTGKDH